MDANSLHDVAMRRAEELPGAELGFPFGPEWEVFKVRGRVFLLLTEASGPQMVTLKVSPLDGEALQQMHPDIRPGYHMNKRHWVTLTPGDSLDEDLVRELVTESYALVVAKLPKKHRPAGPMPATRRATTA